MILTSLTSLTSLISSLISSLLSKILPTHVHVIDVWDRERDPGLQDRPMTTTSPKDRLLESSITREELLVLLRQAQAERDSYQAQALHWETEHTRLAIRLHTIQDSARARG